MTAIEPPARQSGTSARHRARTSVFRRAAQVVLFAGAVLSLAAAFGPLWLARAGIGLAVLTAILVVALAWREVAQARADYAERSVQVLTIHRSARERDERRHADALEGADRQARLVEHDHREQAARERCEAEVTVRQLRSELAEVVRENVARTDQLRARVLEINRLREALAVAEAINAGLDDDGMADVHLLPRHGLIVAPGPVDPGWDNLEVDVARG